MTYGQNMSHTEITTQLGLGVLYSNVHGPSSTEKPNINTPNQAWYEMYKYWELVSDLLGGTFRMQEKAWRWLPREKAEEACEYGERVSRSILYEYFKNATDKLAARPFTRSITLKGQELLPDPIKRFLKDVSGEGKSFSTFLHEALLISARYGMCHALVDFPTTAQNTITNSTEGPVSASRKVFTKADEKKKGYRPTAMLVHPEDLIGFRYRKDQGTSILAEVRIREKHTTYDGEFTETIRPAVRVVREKEWFVRAYFKAEKAGDKDEWRTVKSGINTLGEVPLRTHYCNHRGPLQTMPPMMELVFMNLRHFQSQSDQNNILRFARIGILFGAGLSDEQIEKGVIISPTNFMGSTNADASLTYTEYNGLALDAGEHDIKGIEERMRVLALMPTESGHRNSATGDAIEEGYTTSVAQGWVEDLETFGEEVIRLGCKWINQKPPEELQLDIYSDFSIASRQRDDILALLEAHRSKFLTPELFLSEIQRRGLIAETVSILEELKNLKTWREEEAAFDIKLLIDRAKALQEAGVTENGSLESEAKDRSLNDPPAPRGNRQGTSNSRSRKTENPTDNRRRNRKRDQSSKGSMSPTKSNAGNNGVSGT